MKSAAVIFRDNNVFLTGFVCFLTYSPAEYFCSHSCNKSIIMDNIVEDHNLHNSTTCTV